MKKFLNHFLNSPIIFIIPIVLLANFGEVVMSILIDAYHDEMEDKG